MNVLSFRWEPKNKWVIVEDHLEKWGYAVLSQRSSLLSFIQVAEAIENTWVWSKEITSWEETERNENGMLWSEYARQVL